MGKTSEIQWTDATWNVARGCTKVDEDCKFCYMYRDSFDGTRYNPREVKRTKTVFDMPLKYKQTESEARPGGPPMIFTSSLTDFFHPAIDSYRHEAFDIMRKRKDLIFQVLTKLPHRIPDLLPEDWGTGWDNVWLGTSVGSQASIDRIKHLMWLKATMRAKTLFLSLEPLHGPVHLQHEFDLSPADCGASILEYIDWVIVGGESGHDTGKYRYRPCELKWIEEIVDDCLEEGVPVFVKQLGTHLSKQLKMSDRHGGNIAEFPLQLQYRRFPEI